MLASRASLKNLGPPAWRIETVVSGSACLAMLKMTWLSMMALAEVKALDGVGDGTVYGKINFFPQQAMGMQHTVLHT